MLELKGVVCVYGAIQALHGIDLKLEQGEIVTLIGGNGAGKTTSLMAISGLVPLKGGDILFEGKSLKGMSPNQIVAQGIVQVPEGRRIFPEFSVLENLEMGAYLRQDKKAIKEDLEFVCQLFPILSQRLHQSGGTLSGGEQQMLAISRALMARPRLLLLDEPSLGLAPLIIRQIFEIIKKINQEQGTTIFLVEQNANQALHTASRAYVMENGLITLSGKAQDLAQDDGVRKAYLGIS